MTRVAVVISLFHPAPSVRDLVGSTAEQADLVVLVDDTGDGAGGWAAPLPAGCLLLVNEANLGLAASLNRGCRAALTGGADVVVTLDQDAVLPDDYLGLAAERLAARRQEDRRTAAVAPRRVNGHLHQHRHHHGTHECSLGVVQSGLAVHAEAFEDLDGFREDLVIDALEVDFVMRLHRRGWHLALEDALDLDHAIGDPREGALLGVGFRATNHSPARVYTIARNTTYLATRNLGREPRWSSYACWDLAKRVVKTVLREEDRAAKLRQLLRGVRDGLLGRLGRVR